VRSKDYGPDVLADGWRRPRREVPQVEAQAGLVVEDADGVFCGAVVACAKDAVTLEDARGKRRVFPLARAAFLLEGKPVTLVRPAPLTAARPGAARTASGSRAVPVPPGQRPRARTARASRIYVEGTHDAELVEKIWGDDLRAEGVVVEYLEGVDSLLPVVDAFSPGAGRRLGVLVDHLVDGSKESRIAEAVSSPYVRVTGHPFIDVWQAIKPAVAGIAAWPQVPRGVPWKEGVLSALGWEMSTGAAWRRLLGAVHSFADLEPGLLRSVEELIDFVTEP
jgi:Protein of unknown function (DUF3097)